MNRVAGVACIPDTARWSCRSRKNQFDTGSRQSGHRFAHVLQQAVDDVLDGYLLRFRVKIGQNAMAEYGVRERADILDGHVVTAAEDGPHLVAEQERLDWPQTGAPGDPAPDEVGSRGIGRPRRTDEVDGEARDVLGYVHLLYQLVELEDRAAGKDRFERLGFFRGRRERDGQLVVGRQVIDDDVEHKPVALCLG